MLIKDIKLIIHEKRFAIFPVILIAIAICAVLFGKINTESAKVNIGIADNDRSEYSVLLISYFEENEVFSSYINIIEDTENSIKQRFYNDELDMYIVIPEDFAKNLININNVPMTAVINSSDTTKAVVYKNLLESYGRYITAVEVNCQSLYDIMGEEGYSNDLINSENIAVSYELLFTALGKDEFFKIHEISRFEGISLVNYYIYSAIMLLVLYIGAFAGLGRLGDKLSRVNLRLATTGCKTSKTVLSKTIAYSLVCGGLLFGTLMVINCFAEFTIKSSAILLVPISVFIVSLVLCVIAGFFKSKESYIIFVNMLILLLTIVGGGIIPIMYLPEALAKVARFTPNYWFIKALL